MHNTTAKQSPREWKKIYPYCKMYEDTDFKIASSILKNILKNASLFNFHLKKGQINLHSYEAMRVNLPCFLPCVGL